MINYPNDRLWGFVIQSDGHVPWFPKSYEIYPGIIRWQFKIMHRIATVILRKRLKLAEAA